MTIFVLLFSTGLIALLAILLHLKKISSLIFSALLVLLVIFDFSVLSLDKIYGLHIEQDNLYSEKMAAYDQHMIQQLRLFKTLTQVQLDMSLQVLGQNSKPENEDSIRQKLDWRDQLMVQLKTINFEAKSIQKVKQKIDALVHRYLMETLNQSLRQSMGHRNYSAFVRTRPRQQWTDELFISEVSAFLIKENLMDEKLKMALSRIREFDKSGFLITLH